MTGIRTTGHRTRRRAGVVATLLLSGSLVLGACGGSSNAPPSSATQTPAPTVTQAAATPTVAGEPVSSSDFTAVASAWNQVTSYRMAATSEDPLNPENTFTMTLEVALPDRQRIVIGDTYEAIIVGDTMYLKTGETWMESEVDENMVGSMIPYNLEESLEQASAADVNAGKTGTETLDGVECDVWSIALGQSTLTFWVATTDHLPRKLVISDAATATTVMEATITDYNADLAIEAPN